MFNVNIDDLSKVLTDFGITSPIKAFSELQRYYYEKDDPQSKEVRLILKVELEEAEPLVVRLKNEDGVTKELIESQSIFAKAMVENGIITPRQYKAGGEFTRRYTINGYDVIAAVEDFCENEVKGVDLSIAEKAGKMLAVMHNVSEKLKLHVENEVLFDPFSENDLFDYIAFEELNTAFSGEDKRLFDRICAKYNEYMAMLSPLKSQPRYAVQGDISDCNLFLTADKNLGVFDYNNCGDNNLFCDAVMQAVFFARLMDYTDELKDNHYEKVLDIFLKGYCSERSFTEEENRLYPYILRIINAFWGMDIKWSEDSLVNAVSNGNMEKAGKWLKIIWQRLISI